MKRIVILVLAAAVAFVIPIAAAADQLDPLLSLKVKQPQPNIILLIDTSARMQFDPDGVYYDPHVYGRTGADFELALGVSGANTDVSYRRRFSGFRPVSGAPALRAHTVLVTGDRDPQFARFAAATRLSVAREGLRAAVGANRRVVRFGLLGTRHRDLRLPAEPEAEVVVGEPGQQSPTDTGLAGVWKVTIAEVPAPNGLQEGPAPPLVAADLSGANERVEEILRLEPGAPGALVAAGMDADAVTDAPLDALLVDGRAEALRLIAEDGAGGRCRNTVVVLVTGGGEGTTAPSPDAPGTAATFLALAGRRVPIYVVALAPPAVEAAALQAVAAASGGQYVEITPAMIDRAADRGAVPELVGAINVAIQHGFVDAADMDARPSAGSPYGTVTEQMVAGPVVATVNLAGARSAAGHILPDTVVVSPLTGHVVPQSSNVLVTAGFAVPGDLGTPGFPGRLTARRLYKPVADRTRPAGYRFVADGTLVWTASIPQSGGRNIFTMLEDGTVVPFTVASAPLLSRYLGVTDPAGVIDLVRRQPLGAVIDSTPAVLTPPALSPPPDAEYQAFAARHAARRTLVFVGANDGMLHAFDARLGIEVWAFVPFNLLPKLPTLAEGQPVGDFRYFVDASPRLADIRTASGWRTCLIVGQGAGGSFYQALDVTLAGIGDVVPPDADDAGALTAYFGLPDRIRPMWSFPRLRSFDWTLAPDGDVGAQATDVEKAIGETWSDPLIARIQGVPGRHVVVVGAGLLSHSRERARFGSSPAPGAGTSLCLLDAESGSVLGVRDVGRDGLGETTDACALEEDCVPLRNGLVADPAGSASDGPGGVSAVYIGDLDGRLWRVALGAGADGAPAMTGAPALVYDAGSSQPIVSSVALTRDMPSGRFVFIATGSALLPSGSAVTAGQLVGLAESAGGTASSLGFAVPLGPSVSGEIERPAGPPVIGADVVFFTTSRWTADPCPAASGAAYALAFGGGAAYDLDADGDLDAEDRRMVLATSGRSVTAPFVADRHVYIGTGRSLAILGDPDGYNAGLGRVRLRVLSWRDARK